MIGRSLCRNFAHHWPSDFDLPAASTIPAAPPMSHFFLLVHLKLYVAIASVIVTIFVTDNVLHAIDKEVVPITKAGSFQYLSRIKEFPLLIYLWHSNAEAIVPSRGGTIVFIVLGFEPVPTGVFCSYS